MDGDSNKQESAPIWHDDGDVDATDSSSLHCGHYEVVNTVVFEIAESETTNSATSLHEESGVDMQCDLEEPSCSDVGSQVVEVGQNNEDTNNCAALEDCINGDDMERHEYTAWENSASIVQLSCQGEEMSDETNANLDEATNEEPGTVILTLDCGNSQDMPEPTPPSLDGSIDSSMDASTSANKISFHVVKRASERGRDKLFDSLGYSYTIKRKNSVGITWRCSVRNNAEQCPIIVKQNETGFHVKFSHNHISKAGEEIAAIVRRKAKDAAAKRPNRFVSDYSLAKQVITEVHLANPIPPSVMPKMSNVERIANRHRHSLKPKDPTSLDFDLLMKHLPPNFLRFDIRVDNERHIGFATDRQLHLLQKAKTWYTDGTFHLARQPFSQIFTIHVIVGFGECYKPVPTMMVMMSRKKTADYKAVLRATKSALPRAPKVRRVILDFETTMWKALKKSLPSAKRTLCAYHHRRVLYQEVQDLGLAHTSRVDKGTTKIVRRLMSLCLMPHHFIRDLYAQLRRKATSQPLKDLMKYYRKTWIKSKVWKPKNISAYRLPIRTNNDDEAWHTRLNKGRRSKLFYYLIDLLYEEACEVPMIAKLVSQKKLKRLLGMKYPDVQKRIFKQWKRYGHGKLSGRELLKKIAKIY